MSENDWWTLPWLKADFAIGKDFSLKVPGLWVLLFLAMIFAAGSFAALSPILVRLTDSDHRKTISDLVQKNADTIAENARVIARMEAEIKQAKFMHPESDDATAKTDAPVKTARMKSAIPIDRREPPIRQGGARIEKFQP